MQKTTPMGSTGQGRGLPQHPLNILKTSTPTKKDSIRKSYVSVLLSQRARGFGGEGSGGEREMEQ